MINELNEPLSKLCAIICKGCWKRLLSTDKYVFPLDHNGNRFKKKNDIPFQILERKYKYDSSTAINYLNVNYGFSLLDFKMYYPNIITFSM